MTKSIYDNLEIKSFMVHLIANMKLKWKENNFQAIQLPRIKLHGKCELNVFHWLNFLPKKYYTFPSFGV